MKSSLWNVITDHVGQAKYIYELQSGPLREFLGPGEVLILGP